MLNLRILKTIFFLTTILVSCGEKEEEVVEEVFEGHYNFVDCVDLSIDPEVPCMRIFHTYRGKFFEVRARTDGYDPPPSEKNFNRSGVFQIISQGEDGILQIEYITREYSGTHRNEGIDGGGIRCSISTGRNEPEDRCLNDILGSRFLTVRKVDGGLYGPASFTSGGKTLETISTELADFMMNKVQ